MVNQRILLQQKKIAKTVANQSRLSAVYETKLLNTIEEESFDRLTKLAAKLLKAPVTFVTLLESHRDFVKSQFGMPETLAASREITAHPSFCQHIISHREPLIIEDARESELFNYFPSVKHMGVVAYAGIPLLTDQGQALGTCCVMDYKPRKWTADELEILMELSKSVMTEIQLKTATVRLKEELSNREDLLAIAAHELKTPLTSMKVYTQILKSKVDKNRVLDSDEYIEKIIRQIDKLQNLITHLLDTSSVHKDDAALLRKPTLLTALITEAINECKSTSLPQTITFDSQNEYIVLADKDRIMQVVINLITNASKYAPDAKTIDIDVIADETMVTVRVTDYGQGIDASQKEKIFERFYREKNAIKSAIPGLGLGLYISANIIASHQGTISVDSNKGKGSVFSFTLPRIIS